jgi:hypothetical protein
VAGQAGLMGDYYDDTNLTQLVETRLDPTINFSNWQGAPPGTSLTPDDAYSERWTGFVRVDQGGSWTFTTKSNDGVRLWVAGQQLIDNWGSHANTIDTEDIDLQAGWHPIVLEHFQLGGGMAMQLSFDGPGQGPTIIPSTHLSPVATGNLFPTANAGADLVVVPPDDSISIVGTASDADGAVASTVWTQVAGPPVELVDPSQLVLLAQGFNASATYSFELTVTDDGGAQDVDSMNVEVVSCRGPAVTGVMRPWHRLTLDFNGLLTDEEAAGNPFRDLRMMVTFTHGETGTTYHVPGFFAADGQAHETGADRGRIWRAHFTPDREGSWSYTASFRSGTDIAISLDPQAGTPVLFDGVTGCFVIGPPAAQEPGFLAHGRLAWTGEHYLRHLGSGKPFLKGGANSPENLLAFADFDQTPPSHAFLPHLADWQPGDPTWGAGTKGKALIGGLNYLASKGMNAVYFLTFNLDGDGDDVWMWTSPSERLRFDVSKLAQWEVVFDHMDKLGLQLHVVTQEQENDTGSPALDNGYQGLERSLYYRELIARFGHHLGIVWNLGEENSNTTAQRQAFYDYITAVDPYDHPVVVHSFPDEQPDIYGPMLDVARLEGASLQNLSPDVVHANTLMWRQESADHGERWFIAADETGPSFDGVVPDSVDPDHDLVRCPILWGNLLAGGAGCEWYFGYAYPHDDLDCEDWRSRENMWSQTDHALQFFQQYLPFDEMDPADELIPDGSGYCFAKRGETYAVYLHDAVSSLRADLVDPRAKSVVGEYSNGALAEPALLDLEDSVLTYSVQWYDPRNGGPLQEGTVSSVTGPGEVPIGSPPGLPGEDWVALVRTFNDPPSVMSFVASPNPYDSSAPLDALVQVGDPDGLADISRVQILVWDPGAQYQGTVECTRIAAGLYNFNTGLRISPALGTWVLGAKVTDKAGQVGYQLLSLPVQ